MFSRVTLLEVDTMRITMEEAYADFHDTVLPRLTELPGYEGIVVLTTNSETAIDPAFRRRIRFRIRFPAPDEAHRRQLWKGMVPAEAQLGDDIDFTILARKFPLPGGNIMNALVRAATAAAADGSPITQRHLLRAAELEYAEMGFLA